MGLAPSLGRANATVWDSLSPASGSSFRTGWAIGGGLETAFSPRLTGKLEFLHADLGRNVLFNIVPGVPEAVSFRTDIFRAGISL